MQGSEKSDANAMQVTQERKANLLIQYVVCVSYLGVTEVNVLLNVHPARCPPQCTILVSVALLTVTLHFAGPRVALPYHPANFNISYLFYRYIVLSMLIRPCV